MTRHLLYRRPPGTRTRRGGCRGSGCVPSCEDPPSGGDPVAIFESAAILQYRAEKAGRFLPRDVRGRYEVLQWVAWQVANLGPVAGQLNHFANYATEKIPYAIERFANEMNRLLGVLERRLADRAYLAGEYSIADIATWPWVFPEYQGKRVLAGFPRVARWWDAVAGRRAACRDGAGKGLQRIALADRRLERGLPGRHPEDRGRRDERQERWPRAPRERDQEQAGHEPDAGRRRGRSAVHDA